jgi:hypothetical protein
MAAAIEEIRVDGEIEALPADLQFLRKANANGIIGWFVDKASWNQNARFMSPIVWRLLEKRIREHPNEAREVVDCGGLPIFPSTMFFGLRPSNLSFCFRVVYWGRIFMQRLSP